MPNTQTHNAQQGSARIPVTLELHLTVPNHRTSVVYPLSRFTRKVLVEPDLEVNCISESYDAHWHPRMLDSLGVVATPLI